MNIIERLRLGGYVSPAEFVGAFNRLADVVEGLCGLYASPSHDLVWAAGRPLFRYLDPTLPGAVGQTTSSEKATVNLPSALVNAPGLLLTSAGTFPPGTQPGSVQTSTVTGQTVLPPFTTVTTPFYIQPGQLPGPMTVATNSIIPALGIQIQPGPLPGPALLNAGTTVPTLAFLTTVQQTASYWPSTTVISSPGVGVPAGVVPAPGLLLPGTTTIPSTITTPTGTIPALTVPAQGLFVPPLSVIPSLTIPAQTLSIPIVLPPFVTTPAMTVPSGVLPGPLSLPLYFPVPTPGILIAAGPVTAPGLLFPIGTVIPPPGLQILTGVVPPPGFVFPFVVPLPAGTNTPPPGLYITDTNLVVVNTPGLPGPASVALGTPLLQGSTPQPVPQYLTVTGTVNNAPIGSSPLVVVTASSTPLLTGLSATAPPAPFAQYVVYNSGPSPLVVANASPSSAAGNKIYTGTGADLALPPNQALPLYFDPTLGNYAAGVPISTGGSSTPANYDGWVPYTIDFNAVKTAAGASTTVTMDVVLLGSGEVLSGTVVKCATAFACTGSSFIHADVGPTSADGGLNVIAGYNLDATVGSVSFQLAPAFKFDTANYPFSSGWKVVLTVTSDVNLTNLTAGVVTIWLKLSTLP